VLTAPQLTARRRPTPPDHAHTRRVDRETHELRREQTEVGDGTLHLEPGELSLPAPEIRFDLDLLVSNNVVPRRQHQRAGVVVRVEERDVCPRGQRYA
jgi:hypothetical protein